MSAAPARDEPAAVSLLRQLDQVCDRFEEAWIAGRHPAIEDYVTGVAEAARPDLMRHLLRVELEQRFRGGERPQAEEYRARFPEHAGLIDTLLDHWPPAAGPAAGDGKGHGTPGPEAGQHAEAAVPLPSVPGYEIQAELGRGGMGVVYQARQVALNRPVALKMILAGAYAGERERGRLRAEAGAVARLRHPNVVQIYEVGEHEGRPYLALEFVEGGSLADRLGGTPQPARAAAGLVEAVARAVHHAHRHGIIHRDLKPANVLLAASDPRSSVSPDRRRPGEVLAAENGLLNALPKITDFGLARLLDQDPGRTGSGAIVGTPSYMAPEQADGRAHTAGPAADVYALGAILYEALTGRPPFKAATALETLEQVRHQELVPPRRLQPQVPRDLETICLKCLHKEPRRRYADAAALADDLRAFLERRPIRARPVGLAGQALKWARRRPAVAALAAAVVCVSALAVGLVSWQWSVAVTAGREAEAARREEEEQRRQAERLAVRLSLGRGQLLCEEGDLGPGMLWLAHTLEIGPAEDEDVRRAVGLSLAAWRRRLHPLRTLLAHPAPVQTAAFSPDGRTVVTVAADKRVRLWEASTGRPVGQPLEHPGEILAVAFSRDSRLVVTCCADGTARLWQADTGHPFGRPLTHAAPVRAAAFLPDGRTVVTAAGHTIRLWEAATGRLLHQRQHPGAVLALALGPDGKKVLTGGSDGTARLWASDTLKPVGPTLLPRAGGEIVTVRFSPHGKVLLALSRDERKRGDTTVWLWDAASGTHVTNLFHHYWVPAVAFSPDEDWVVTGSEDHTAQVWETKERWGPVCRPLPHNDTVQAVAFSPDGKTLLTGSQDRTARLWEWDDATATFRPRGQPLEHEGAVTAVAFGPGGRTFLTASKDGTARLWEPAPALPYDAEFTDVGQVMALALSPDGDTLVAGTDHAKAWRWRLPKGQRLTPPLKHDDHVWAVAFSPDGQTIVTGSRDKTARLWDAATGAEWQKLTHTGRVQCLAVSPDGQTLLTGGGDTGLGEAWFWELATGELLGPSLKLPGTVWQVAFSPNSRTCAIASGDTEVRLWDVATREPVGPPLRHQDRVVALAFSPDGRALVTGSTDKTARLWHTATGAPLGSGPLQHQGGVWAVAFSPDGRTVVTGSRDGAAHLWDAATGMPIGPPWPHHGVVWAVACDPGGRAAYTGSADKTVRRWPMPRPVEGERERIKLWVQVMTAMELDGSGSAHGLDAATWEKRRQRLDQLGGPPLP